MSVPQESPNANLLPVFFFHGLTGVPEMGGSLEKACAVQGRAVVSLSFCPGVESFISLHKQVPLAIKQIRSIVAYDDRFKNGYVFVGHSQGGVLARAVVEEMDDHQVHTLISLAGVQNGLFYGPQDEDKETLQVFLNLFGPGTMPDALDYESYRNDAVTWRGKVQRDFAVELTQHKEFQDEISFTNLTRMPSRNDWLATNSFLPRINNVNKRESAEDIADQERRKNNFLKLKAAHFLVSPQDGYVAPWQISVFGHYSEVDSIEEIETKFADFKIVEMRDTIEYQEDTFGLQSLDKRGGLHLNVVPNVPHNAWFTDSSLMDDPEQIIKYQTVFDSYISPAFP